MGAKETAKNLHLFDSHCLKTFEKRIVTLKAAVLIWLKLLMLYAKIRKIKTMKYLVKQRSKNDILNCTLS